MRTKTQIYDLILRYAKQDGRVRAVLLNGSRVNKNIPKDDYQDFDVVYYVNDFESFIDDHSWINVFGERLIMQLPCYMDGDWEYHFTYLMQFKDGNRIDLTIIKANKVEESLKDEDQLAILLLDKDGIIPKLPEANDKIYWVKKPNQKEFSDCCNEFYWVSLYIAKGLNRGEILYAIHHLDYCVRKEFLKMVKWLAGINTNFSCSVGKFYKYLNKYIDQQTWDDVIKTYSLAKNDDLWETLISIQTAFKRVSELVAKELGLQINKQEQNNVYSYLIKMKEKNTS